MTIHNRRNCQLFAANVGFLGTKQARLRARLLAIPSTSTSLSRDFVPYLAEYVRAECGRRPNGWLENHNIDRIERRERDGETIW